MSNESNHGLAKSPDRWPDNDLERVPCCPVCGCNRRRLMYAGLEDRIFKVAPGQWTLYQCDECHSAWLDPRPTPNSIGRAYASYYTHNPVDHPIVRRKGVLRTAIHDAMNGYRNVCYGTRREPALRIGRWLVALFPSLRAAVDAQCRHLPRLASGSLLDVGFGNGGFLKLAEEMNWRAEGIDFDPGAVAAARSRGLNVRHVNASAMELPQSSYDVITISHVIEHVHEPVRLLEGLFKALKPGGMLWLDTPNLDGKGHQRFGPNWRDLDPPRHLILFGGDTLFDVLRRCGFVDLRRRWRGLSVFDVYPASEALERDGDPLKNSRQGRPPLREICAELNEMTVPKRREFITLTARKPGAE